MSNEENSEESNYHNRSEESTYHNQNAFDEEKSEEFSDEVGNSYHLETVGRENIIPKLTSVKALCYNKIIFIKQLKSL